MNKKHIIIVAGGKGLRMGCELPKQFIPLCGKPVLMHTIEAFYRYDNAIDIILVLPVSHQAYWKELCNEYVFDIPHRIANGGETRFHSVESGLSLVDEGYVGVHDGVRPFASTELIGRCFNEAICRKAVIPVVHSTDSLREMIDEQGSRIIDRSRIRLVQTPQVFAADLLKDAYKQPYSDLFTDDASVVESIDVKIALAEGESTNIKITTPIDLKVGELILNERS